MKHYHMFELNGSENRINNYLTCTISLICFWCFIPRNLCYDEAEWSSISTIWCRQIFMGRRVRWWLGPIFWPSYGVIQINTDGPSQRCHLSVALSFVKECTKAALYLGGNSFGNGKYAVRTKVSNTQEDNGNDDCAAFGDLKKVRSYTGPAAKERQNQWPQLVN